MTLTGYFSRACEYLLLTGCLAGILFEAILIIFVGFPNFPGGLYGTFFSCGAAVFFSYHSFAHIRSVSKAAYNKVRSTGNKARAYVLGIRCDA